MPIQFRSQILFVVGSCAALAACSGSGNEKPGGQVSQFAPGAADPCKNPLHTPYMSDGACIEPPPADMGFQLYFGPGMDANYDDPNALAPYVLGPGEDLVLCESMTTPNTEVKFSQEQHLRSRTGTHHVLYFRKDGTDAGPPSGSPVDGSTATECRSMSLAKGYQFFLALESGLSPEGAVLDVPLPGNDPSKLTPQDRGTALSVAPHTNLWVEAHFANTSDAPILREIWANVLYMDKSAVTQVMEPLFWAGFTGCGGPGLEGITSGCTDDRARVPPGTKSFIYDANPVPVTTQQRIFGIASHVHSHALRQTLSLTRAGSTTSNVIYQTFNWSEPLYAEFDDSHVYPPVNDTTDGSMSGKLLINPGDTFNFECEYQNLDLTYDLVWGDKTYIREMCNLFGYWGYGPVDGTSQQWLTFSP